MVAKVLAFKLGVAAVAVATAGWAITGPDSIANNLADDLRVWGAKGRLVQVSDSEPVGDRYAILIVLGRNGSQDPDGPFETDLRNMIAPVITSWADEYQKITGARLLDDVAVFGYWYNSNLADPKIANDLFRKLESHPYFTQAKAVYSATGYSKASNVLFWHWTGEGDRKMEAVVSSGGPQLGAPLADVRIAKQALSKTLGLPMGLIEKGFKQMKVDLSSPGTQWLTPMYPQLIDQRRKHPLTADWYLIAGKTTPSGGSKLATYFDIANWLDCISLNEGMGQDVPAYRLGARALANVGVSCGSDGMVPVDSALCKGYAGEAHTFILEAHNHSQMIQGNGGTELHRLMLACLLPRIMAHKDQRVKAFDIWLPELPDLSALSATQISQLEQAKLIGVNERSEVVTLDSANKMHSLSLPTGNYSWPQWVGDKNIVAEREAGGRHDIVMVRSDGGMVQLTTNGCSRFPAVQDDGMLIVFASDDDLVVRSVGGLAQAVVEGNVTLDSPPVFLGDKIYYANVVGDGRHELRRVKITDKRQALALTEIVADNMAYPTRVGDLLLAFQRDGETLRPVAVTKQWGGLVNVEMQLGVKFLLSQSELPSVDELETTNDGQVYVLMGYDLRQLDMRQISNQTLPRLEELRRRIRGAPPQAVPTVTLDQVLPVVVTGLRQIDSK